ncbi:MAG: hypothetical protein QOF35_384, partial [Actinomycetota bacterium]|nr:hypothetical protein [Actinomycetota bacterium]
MAYLHGAGYAMVYNDHFADLLGARHPHAWGQHAALVMPEIWSRPGYAEAVDNVFAGGPSFHDEGEMLDVSSRVQSHPDWAYLARSYSAVRDTEGSVLGVLVVVVEVAPVLVLVGGVEQGDQGAARWRGTELWDETDARQPLIWSGFRAGARSAEPAVSASDQRFVAEGTGQRILPINGPDVGGSLGYRGVPRHLPDVQMLTLAPRDQSDSDEAATSGEFYDVFSLPDGRLALTIGDVIGAGTAAAALRAEVKDSLRGAALSSLDANVIFSTVDELVTDLDPGWPPLQIAEPGSASTGSVDTDSGTTDTGSTDTGSTDTGSTDSVDTDSVDTDSVDIDGGGFGGELFVTALLGIFDPATGDLLLASAGQLPPA